MLISKHIGVTVNVGIGLDGEGVYIMLVLKM